jgi:transcriptional regulator with XRE-family HTH domain
MGIAAKPISKRELLAYQADVKGSIFRQIRELLSHLKERGFTQRELADKIGMDAGQLSRRLRGDYDLQLETLSDLARGLDCRIDVKLMPLAAAMNASEEKPAKAPDQNARQTWLETAADNACASDQNYSSRLREIEGVNDNSPTMSARKLSEIRAQA